MRDGFSDSIGAGYSNANAATLVEKPGMEGWCMDVDSARKITCICLTDNHGRIVS